MSCIARINIMKDFFNNINYYFKYTVNIFFKWSRSNLRRQVSIYIYIYVYVSFTHSQH